MKFKWQECTIGDLGQIVTGKTPPTKNNEYWGGKVMFITPKDIQATKHIFKTERYVTSEGKVAVRGAILPKGSICVSCIGNIGYLGITTEECISNQQINSIIVNETNDIDFVYYLLKSLWTYFKNYEGQSTALSILNKTQFSKIKVQMPNIEVQKKIASILKILDEKIELNNEINNNLEQQAQAIFKSWFVDFEPFGGVQPSEMQFIPLQELCKVVTKGTTPTTLGKSFASSGINFIKAESILDNHSIDNSKFAFIDEETNALLKRSFIKANDIIFTIAGTLGRFAMVDNSVLPANTNQAVAIIRPDENKITPAYLYSFFIGNWHNEYYSKRIQQAVQANLSLTTIKSLPIAVLNNTTMSNYDKLVSPLFALMKNNEEENRRLSKLRDALLPRLMSGELDVSDIEL